MMNIQPGELRVSWVGLLCYNTTFKPLLPHPKIALKYNITNDCFHICIIIITLMTGAVWRILLFVWGYQADCSSLCESWLCTVSCIGGELQPTGGLSLPGRGSEEGSKVTKSISCELLRASSVVTHRGSQARRGTLPPPSFCFLSLFLYFPLEVVLDAHTTPFPHTCIHAGHEHTHMHWSLSSPLLECSLVSAVMQCSPVISWELCVLHSLPSVLFFFLY